MHQRIRRITIVLFTGLALAMGGSGCGDDADGAGTSAPGDGPTSVTAPAPEAQGGERVGAEGGVIGLDFGEDSTSAAADESGASGDHTRERPPQIELEIPAGALDEDVDITISAYPATPESAARPEGYRVASRIFEFGPEGLTFNEPITVRMRYSGSADGLSVYWTEPGSRSVYGEVDAAVLDRGVASAQVTHFSRGFVGTTCTPDCAGRECGSDGCGGLCGTCGSGEGCSDGTCEPFDSVAPTATATALTCEANADCHASEVCVSGFCEPLPPATTSSAGPATTTTSTMEPLPPVTTQAGSCAMDSDCPSGQDCIEGVCEPAGSGAGCMSNDDCSSGEVCIENACEPAGSGNPGGSSAECNTSDDCGSENTCSEGVCVPVGSGEPTCTENSDCLPGEVCIEGVCAAG